LKNRAKGDDLNDSDIMAYSTMNADNTADDDEPPVLGSGGAIMAALEQKNGGDEAPKKEIKKTVPKKIIPK